MGYGLSPLNDMYMITRANLGCQPLVFTTNDVDEGVIKYPIDEGLARNMEIKYRAINVSNFFAHLSLIVCKHGSFFYEKIDFIIDNIVYLFYLFMF